jgi:GT2 family glycosyltransferase/glycosyltransferase involved in cell wall biosynthesis
MTGPRNLLVITEEFSSGGLETYIRGEVEVLSSLGFHCHLACGERFSQSTFAPGLESVTTDIALGPSASVSDLLGAIDSLRDLVIEQTISAIHAHGFTSLIVGSIVAELQSIPDLITIHGPSLSNGAYGPLFDFLVDSAVLPGASAVLVVSEELRSLYSPYVDASRLIVASNAVAIPALGRKGNPADRTRWLYASRLDQAKVVGLKKLLVFVASGADDRLDIAGDGPESDAVRRWVQDSALGDRVRLLGAVEDLPSIMPRYGMVFGMGRVMLEALAAGVPACLVGYDGVKGVVTERLFEEAALANFSGRYLPIVESAELREQLASALESDTERLRLRLRVMSDFSQSTVWKGFAGLLESTKARPRGLLTAVVSALRQCAEATAEERLPYLSSPQVRAVVGRLSSAPQFISANLASSFNFHIGMSAAAPIGQSPLALVGAQLASQQLAMGELRERVLQTELALREAEARADSSAKEAALLQEERVRLCDDLEQARADALRLSDWASRINSSPVRYGLKKNLLAALRRVFRWLPFEHKVKVRLRKLLRRASHCTIHGGQQKDLLEPHNLRVLTKRSSCSLQPLRRDVFVFAVIDWHFRFQRPQQLAISLAQTGKRVFYISNEFIDSSEPGYEIERIVQDIYQVRLRVPGAEPIYGSLPTAAAQHMLFSGLGQLMLDYCVSGLYGIVHHPFWKQTAWSVPNCIRVYDCMDHHEGFGGVATDLVQAEESLLRCADQVIVTSSWLEEFARKYSREIVVIRNAGDFDFFSRKPETTYSDTLGRKVVGYYGAIAEWFDVELLTFLAEKNPDVLFLLVGRDTVDAKRKLSRLANVIFTGEVPYRDLPHYLYGFDVCILPFRVLPLTLATNPVKVYEYLAAGRPVVAADLPEMRQFEGCVRVANQYEDFHEELVAALGERERHDMVELRRAFARNQTWNHRARDLIKHLESVTLPRVSVIVLTYNNLGLSQACLRSLLERTDYPNLEVIVVDNASTDGTPDFLRSLGASDTRVKVRLNDENLGFAAGNNVGLADATGAYLVLLNNDTVVTDGWLMTLIRHLQDDSAIGLVGPVTNNIGNEARIELNYDTELDLYDVARTYTLAHIGARRALNNVAFFCVAMPRKTYEVCGPLCTDYGIGFFEDDDYCRRVEQADLKVVCVEDVFVHHHLSASFSKLDSIDKTALFDRNKAIYEAKWGRWEPHEYR